MHVHDRTREPDFSSSDGFDQLSINLPEIAPPPSPTNNNFPRILNGTDDFSQWQLNRFNRTGNIELCELFAPSTRFVRRNLKFMTLLYFPFSIFVMISLYYNLPALYVVVDSIFSLVATSICFSLIAGEEHSSRLHFLLSYQGFSALIIQLLRSISFVLTALSLYHRKSTTNIRLLFTILLRFLTHYHSCFTFEGRALSVTAAFSFSFRLSVKAIPIVQSFSIEFLMELLSVLGLVTFGFTRWLSLAIRSYVFLAVCGSGSALLTPSNFL